MTVTQNHPFLAMTAKSLIHLVPHALGWAPSQDSHEVSSPRPTPALSTDMSGFLLRLVSSYIIISDYINHHRLLHKQQPKPLVLCKNTMLQTFDRWLITTYPLIRLHCRSVFEMQMENHGISIVHVMIVEGIDQR